MAWFRDQCLVMDQIHSDIGSMGIVTIHTCWGPQDLCIPNCYILDGNVENKCHVPSIWNTYTWVIHRVSMCVNVKGFCVIILCSHERPCKKHCLMSMFTCVFIISQTSISQMQINTLDPSWHKDANFEHICGQTRWLPLDPLALMFEMVYIRQL